MNVQNKRVLVVGLARSGFAVTRALARRGAVVTVTDNKPPAEFREVLPQLIKDKVGLELGSQRVETFLRHQMIVISPGVPWSLPQLQAAREQGIPVYPEVEAASWFLEGTLVGVTGSNGKTTTTALLGDMLKASGFPTFVGGNIGNALSQAVDSAAPGTKFVTELSSFQLEGIHDFGPHVAVMLNLSPNHLDRHPNLEAYAQAKRQIFRNQGGKDYAVLNADDPWVAGLAATVASQPVFFSRRRELASGVFASGGRIYYRVRHLERVLFETGDVSLRGDFNLEDVLAATTAACVLGTDFAAIRKAVREFQAVEHRLEFVRKIQEVDFYNNSKATSVDATLKSLDAFERGVHLIMGGKDKGAPYAPLLPLIKDRVREVLLIGAAAPVIAQQLAGSTELVQAGDLSTAVYEAFTRSRPGDTVLLAPACSSFDQFHDYEERGRVFKELVNRLASDASAGRVVRSPESRVRGLESRVRGPGSGVRGLESAVTNLESGISPAGGQGPGIPPKAPEPAPEPVATPGGAPIAALETPPSPAPDVVTEKGSVEKPSPVRKRARGRPKGLLDQQDALPLLSKMASLEFPASQQGSEVPPAGTQSSLGPIEPPADSPPAAEAAPPEPEKTEPVVAGPRHLELSYVYEVDAIEMPGLELPVAAEYESEAPYSAGKAELPDDEVLPYEARPAAEGESARLRPPHPSRPG